DDALMGTWAGPSAVCCTGGKQIGATLDRNGLRPCRYQVTTDDLAVLASDAGVLPYDAKDIRKEGAPATGAHVPRGHGAGAHHRRRGDQGRDRQAEAVPGLGDPVPRLARRAAGAAERAAAGPPDAPSAPAGVRLHGRRAEDGRHAD